LIQTVTDVPISLNHAWKKDFQKSIDSHLNGRKEDVQAIREELRNL